MFIETKNGELVNLERVSVVSFHDKGIVAKTTDVSYVYIVSEENFEFLKQADVHKKEQFFRKLLSAIAEMLYKTQMRAIPWRVIEQIAKEKVWQNLWRHELNSLAW